MLVTVLQAMDSAYICCLQCIMHSFYGVRACDCMYLCLCFHVSSIHAHDQVFWAFYHEQMLSCRLTVMEIVRGLYELASGLDHMHDRGIADQDVQRGNVLISFTNSTWKKGDLGSAARCRIIGAYNWLDAKKCR